MSCLVAYGKVGMAKQPPASGNALPPRLAKQPLDRSAAPLSELSIRYYHFRDAAPGWVTDTHQHLVPQWYFCSYGAINVTIDGVVHALRSEESVLVAPRAARKIEVDTRAAGYLVTMFEVGDQFNFAAVYNRVLTLPGEARDDAHALVAEIIRPGGSDSRLLSQSLAVRVLLSLCRANSKKSTTTLSALNAQGHAQVVAQAETFMQRNLNRQLKRADIAEAVHVSEPHLARLFKATIGRSIIDRLVELRITQAQMLLLESTMSVTQIATAVGITSFSYFSKAFKQLVGMTPSDFRKSGGRVY